MCCDDTVRKVKRSQQRRNAPNPTHSSETVKPKAFINDLKGGLKGIPPPSLTDYIDPTRVMQSGAEGAMQCNPKGANPQMAIAVTIKNCKTDAGDREPPGPC